MGCGRLEAAILADARKILSSNYPALEHYTLREEGLDAVGVFYKAYKPPMKLVIVGWGHIGAPLKLMGEATGFETTMVDVAPSSYY